MMTGEDAYAPYLPRLARTWRADRGDTGRVLDGSLVGIDISGFTALSERLAVRGKLGAEELIDAISTCYDGLIRLALARGGDVLKFRGDALLLFFDGAGHELQAASAALEMQALIDRIGAMESSVGPVRLRMAVGVHSGVTHFFVVGHAHEELLVAGPAATATLALEDAAEAGEILVSPRTSEALPDGFVGGTRAGARLLRPGAPPAALPATSADAGTGAGLARLVPAPLRLPIAESALEAEHRHASTAFLRYSGADALVRDPAAAGHAFAELGQVVGAAAEEYDVTWLESDIDRDGGKLYLVAGAPWSAGGDEERLLRALRSILDAGTTVPLAAGANQGPVFAGEIGSPLRRTYAVMGDTVNLAARLAGRAQPGQLLASRALVDRSRTRFELEPQPFLVKGKDAPISAFWVGAAREHDTATDDERRLDLVGREGELALFAEATAAARSRELRLLELSGEPGIGKSRLVHELVTGALGFQQLVARAQQYESATPFFAFRSLLRPLAGITPEQNATAAGAALVPWVQAVMPDLAPWLPLLAIPFDADVPGTPEADEIDPSFRQRRLHEVVDGFLTRMLLMPTLLVFEDAHWMDDASAFLLRHLLASAAPRPWLVCVTRRPEGETFVSADDPRATAIALAPLDGDAAAGLALAAAGDTAVSPTELAQLAARSGGNPLFVRELVAARGAAGDGALPETVEAVITTRIDTLDPIDRLLLRCASVIGPSFDVELIGEVLAAERGEVGDVNRLERLDEFIAFEGASMLRFRHDLFRAVGYGGLSYRRRRELHRIVGEVLERRAGESGEENAGLLSLHFFEAGEHDKAWGYAVAAGDRARGRFANVDAAELYERALAAAEHLTPDDAAVATVGESLGDVCEVAARYERARAAYENALGLVGDDSTARTRLLRKLGILLERQGRYEEALEWHRSALWGAEAAVPSPALEAEQAELELELGVVLFRRGQYAECSEFAQRAAERARRLGDRRALAHAYRILDTADLALGGSNETYLDRAIPIYEELGDLLGKAIALNNRGMRAYYAGRWDEAVRCYTESRDAEHSAGDVVRAATALNNEAEILLEQGKLDAAHAALEEALRTYRASGYAFGAAAVTANLGRVAAAGGSFEDAHRLFDQAIAEFGEIGADGFAGEATARRAECLVLEGRHPESRTLLAALLARDDADGRRPLLERLLGYALVQARQRDDAAPHFGLSLEAARTGNVQFEEASTLLALARTGIDPGAEGDARAILDRLGVVSTPHVPLP